MGIARRGRDSNLTSAGSHDRRHECDRFVVDGRASRRGVRLGAGLRDRWRRACRLALIYFAFVNYTTLGYGDVTPVLRWNLLGPMTAMNGVLMFGWSTAVIFEVLRKVLRDEQGT